jgi:hypothetical protein
MASTAEQRLVLQFLVAEPHQRLERDLVAEPVIVAQLEHFGVDEALDQAKDIGVGAAPDHILLDVPPHAFGCLDRTRIPLIPRDFVARILVLQVRDARVFAKLANVLYVAHAFLRLVPIAKIAIDRTAGCRKGGRKTLRRT